MAPIYVVPPGGSEDEEKLVREKLEALAQQVGRVAVKHRLAEVTITTALNNDGTVDYTIEARGVDEAVT